MSVFWSVRKFGPPLPYVKRSLLDLPLKVWLEGCAFLPPPPHPYVKSSLLDLPLKVR